MSFPVSAVSRSSQPGADKWHGAFSYDFNDESLNSRNPFTTVRAPYQQRAFNVNLSGPIIPKRASFSAYFDATYSDANSVVNATTLDPITLKPIVVNETFITPDKNMYGNACIDFKINKAHTLVGRASYSESTQDLQGIGGFFCLPLGRVQRPTLQFHFADNRNSAYQRKDGQRNTLSVHSQPLQSVERE